MAKHYAIRKTEGISETSDVAVASPSTGQVLKWNGTNWVNDTDATGGGGATNLDGLSDVTIASLSTGQVLKFNGTVWVNDTDATGGGGASPASETTAGIAEIATQAETNTGTDDERIVTPLKLASRTATDTRAGVVELATDAETQTGTDTARAVTPANLAARTATETRTGVVELATTAEAVTGTDTTRAVTPAGVDAAIDARYQYETIYWTFDGTAAVTTGDKRVPVTATGTIVKAWATANTAPTGAALIFDINLSGSTIWSTSGNRVQIAAAANSGTQTTFNTTAVTEDQYFTCDLDQIGSTVAGSNIVVALKYRYAL